MGRESASVVLIAAASAMSGLVACSGASSPTDTAGAGDVAGGDTDVVVGGDPGQGDESGDSAAGDSLLAPTGDTSIAPVGGDTFTGDDLRGDNSLSRGDTSSPAGDAATALACIDDPTCTCPRADGTPCELDFSVLTYNVHGLPLDFTNPARFREIGDRLAGRRAAGTAPDFVVLQEAFVDAAQELISRSGYPHVAEGPDPSPVLLSSGLFILSNHPILSVETIVYNNCAVADCGARKGSVAAHVALPGIPNPFVILTTHLQAHKENDGIRIQQIDQQLDYLSDVEIFTYPSVYAGDFNFKARDDHEAHPSYVHFLANTPYTSTGGTCVADPVACPIDIGPDGNTDMNDVWWSTNDHLFHHAPPNSGYSIEALQFDIEMTAPFNNQPLSDHWALEAHYRLTK